VPTELVTDLQARAWSRPAAEVLDALEVSADRGLASDEVEARRSRYGPNLLRETRRRSAWQVLVAQFKSLVIALLAVAAGVSFAFGDWVEGVAILVVLLLNSAIGFVAELRALRSMESLRRLGSVETRVRRDGEERRIPAEELVPGDIVPIEEGDVVTADLRLIEANRLEADESTLTGESVPVVKTAEVADAEAGLAERQSMLFKGTAVTRGTGGGVVIATGMASELGRIASLAQEAEKEATPLEERLEALGRRLIWLTLAVAALTIGVGIARGREALLMVETGIALAVAAIPEGLPIVATLALARGMWRMARRNALVNRLAAVETLGATTLIFTDKTGTLTENRMTARDLWLPTGRYRVRGEDLDPSGAFLRQQADAAEAVPSTAAAPDPPLTSLLEAGVLCNNASLGGGEGSSLETIGDPLEIALLTLGRRADIERHELLKAAPEVREEAFDRTTQMMATFHRHGEALRVAVKGAPERVIEASSEELTHAGRQALSSEQREVWLERNRQMAADGLRVLALAERRAGTADEDPYRSLTFLGLVGLHDPPRDEVRGALEACARAGVRVVMVTGDHAATATAIARAVGLAGEGEAEALVGKDLPDLATASEEERRALRRCSIFARVEPAQKLDLIALHQQAGEIVAMTGDGVNDAPALRKADIGIAMGLRGTQVAQEAADMVLRDDAFGSIVVAIEQGRVIFGNIRRFVYYLLSCNVSEILIVAAATMLQTPLPILPLQILFLNLVTDVFPALALAFGEGDATEMEQPPRDPAEPILARRHWLGIAGFGVLIALCVLAALFVALHRFGFSDERAVTVSFLTLALAQLWHVFSTRDRGTHPFFNQVTRNPWVWGALLLCVGLLVVAVHVPFLAGVLGVASPGRRGWSTAFGLSLIPWVAGLIARGRPAGKPEPRSEPQGTSSTPSGGRQ
jgi:Ca2+-transporting ATPase